MKKLFLLIMICGHFVSGFSQRTFEFDYILEYQHRHRKTGEIHTWYYLTNSKDNSYSVHMTEYPKGVYQLSFSDYFGTHGRASVTKEDFFRTETLTMDCDKFHQHEHRTNTSKYAFGSLSDTTINGKPHKRYVYKPVDPKQEKRRKLATETYILEPGTEFHLPRFHYTSAYKLWRSGAAVPNGIVYKSYFIKPKAKKVTDGPILLSYTKLKKAILVPEDCLKKRIKRV